MSEFQNIVPIILFAFLLWLVGLTVVFYRLLHHYKRVAKIAKGGDLMKLIESLLDNNDNVSSKLKFVESQITRIDKRLVSPLQKVGLVRFNPFKEIGGDHSFSLSLLDEEDNGFIITGLHTRDRTRVYLKEIKSGSSKVELSTEETASLNKAKKIKI